MVSATDNPQPLFYRGNIKAIVLELVGGSRDESAFSRIITDPDHLGMEVDTGDFLEVINNEDNDTIHTLKGFFRKL